MQRAGVWLAVVVLTLPLGGCKPRHRLERIPRADGAFVLTFDHVSEWGGLSEDAIVSVQEKQGLAAKVAVFHNVVALSATWLGPEDIQICHNARVQDYKTELVLNTLSGKRTFHFHYAC